VPCATAVVDCLVPAGGRRVAWSGLRCVLRGGQRGVGVWGRHGAAGSDAC
jgi:hypothetical protein